MRWNNHLELVGEHAYMGASQYHWLRYDDAKVVEVYRHQLAKERGTKLHEYAALSISIGQKLPRTNATLNRFVNESISFGMRPEQVLYYSPMCFGTTDAISFSKNVLRISDLKTGIKPAHFDQLYIYAALFCLEYRVKPAELDRIELRIYQFDQVFYEEPDPDLITHIMDKIVHDDQILAKMKEEER